MSEICSATPYISFSQLFREKTNQIELVIPSLWKNCLKNEILCYPAAKIWPPLSLLSLLYLQSISRPDLHWKRPPGIYNPTSSKELFDDYFAQSFLFMGTLAFGNSNQMLCPNILYFKFLFNDTKFWKVFWSCQVWNSWNMLHLAIMIKEQSIQYLQSPCLFDHTFPHTPTIPWGVFKQTYENLKVAQN